MNNATLEHLNITVSHPEQTAKLLQDIFGWQIRWQGASIHDGESYHVGSEDCYIAIYSNSDTKTSNETSYYAIGGMNHLGIVVDDLEQTEQRVAAAGLTPYSHANYEPGKRFYFKDEDGIEYEVVSYD